ncbi:MAG: hypothetical protein GY746_16895, partial [Gammaproteobacteria bacterium]|nr:hypothetical protein [Gammaproteobacteria bacterium]
MLLNTCYKVIFVLLFCAVANISLVGNASAANAPICDAQADIPVAECNTLVDLYNATDGPNWDEGWNLTNTPCSWHGVTCSTGSPGHVTILSLISNNLTGTLPDLALPNLRELDLSENQLSGDIPDFNLPELTMLNLEANQLSGDIPDFSNLSKLEWLYLESNQLSGEIPDFSKLPNLKALYLNSNQLSGEIPAFSKLPLKFLYLNSNQLSGEIPDLPDTLTFFSGNFGYNALTADPFGDGARLDPDWADTQTIPPSGVSA